MDKMNTPTFTLAEVAIAAGTKSSTLRQWLFRDWFTLDAEDAPAHTPGATTYLTGKTALAMGLAVHLGGGVVPLELAVKAALRFAYSGTDEGQERHGLIRRPGYLFNADDTLAVFSRGEGRDDWQVAILPKVDGMTIEQCITSGSYGMSSLESLVVCPLFNAVTKLRNRLGLPEDRGDFNR